MAELVSSMSSKGQVTIPREVRQRLGLEPGDRVVFAVGAEGVSIRPAREQLASVYAAVPALSREMDLERMIELAREEHAWHVASEGLGDGTEVPG